MDELREKYVQGKMTEAEQKAYEEGLSATEKKELAAELGIRAGLEGGFREELKQKVRSFEQQESTSRRINPAYISIAASLVLAASLVFYLTREQTPLFDQYYEVYANYEVTVVRSDDNLSKREEAYHAYDQGNYKAAVSAFGKLDTLKPADYFFRGISLIELERYSEALTDLSKKVLSGDKDYADAAFWYTSLIYLKQEKAEKARVLLQTLSTGESTFSERAKDLLEAL